MTEPEAISQADLRRLSPSPLVRRYGNEVVLAAGGSPILDVACGGGRNSVWLAHLGGRVLGIDIDLRRIGAERTRFVDSLLNRAFERVELLKADLVREVWPFPPSSVGGIVNIHFLQESLLRSFCRSVVSGGLLIMETVPARGGNYLQLPRAGLLRGALEDSFSFVFYKERPAGPRGIDAVTVQLLAKRR